MTLQTISKTEGLQVQTESEKKCLHQWIIDPPYGPVSKGICKVCGTEGDFYNDVS